MDSLGRRRTGNESETERRIKTEFLRQMDQITRIKERVSVFATTNMPWELDIAALRRFQRRVLVPMPNHATRIEIFKLHAGTQHCLGNEDFDFLAGKTDGYSGSDLSTLVNDGLMRPIKQLQQAQYFKRVDRAEVMMQLDLFKSKYMIYADDGVYDEDGDSPLAVSLACEETKDNNTSSSRLSPQKEVDELKSSYWMPVQ